MFFFDQPEPMTTDDLKNHENYQTNFIGCVCLKKFYKKTWVMLIEKMEITNVTIQVH